MAKIFSSDMPVTHSSAMRQPRAVFSESDRFILQIVSACLQKHDNPEFNRLCAEVRENIDLIALIVIGAMLISVLLSPPAPKLPEQNWRF